MMNSVLSVGGVCIGELLFSSLKMLFLCCEEGKEKGGMTEWVCGTQMIYSRETESPHFKAFLLFPKWGWKSAAWLSPNKWLLLPFHSTQRPNPRTTWATNVDSDWDHHSMCQTLLTTHKNTLTAALWSENGPERENVKEVSTVISPKERP